MNPHYSAKYNYSEFLEHYGWNDTISSVMIPQGYSTSFYNAGDLTQYLGDLTGPLYDAWDDRLTLVC